MKIFGLNHCLNIRKALWIPVVIYEAVRVDRLVLLNLLLTTYRFVVSIWINKPHVCQHKTLGVQNWYAQLSRQMEMRDHSHSTSTYQTDCDLTTVQLQL